MKKRKKSLVNKKLDIDWVNHSKSLHIHNDNFVNWYMRLHFYCMCTFLCTEYPYSIGILTSIVS